MLQPIQRPYRTLRRQTLIVWVLGVIFFLCLPVEAMVKNGAAPPVKSLQARGASPATNRLHQLAPSFIPPNLHNLSPWNVHFYAVPSGDGDSLLISTGQTNQLNAFVNAELTTAGSPKKIFRMSYQTGKEAYEAMDVPLGAVQTVEGTIALTADEDGNDTAEQETSQVNFVRFFVRSNSPTVIHSDDIDVLIDQGSLEADRSALLMDTNAPRQPLPTGYRQIWKPYTLRVSGADVVTARPMEITMKYSDLKLGNVDAHTLTILQWEPAQAQWQDLGGTLFNLIDRTIVTQTQRFSDYILVAAPRWVDEFSDATGLSAREHVDVLVGSGELVLDGLSLTGTVTSKIITPTIPPYQWGVLTYHSTVPAGASLVIDILDRQGQLLFSNVASGYDLSDLEQEAYPSLMLRATYVTDNKANSPRLDRWQITWTTLTPPPLQVFLPLISGVSN